jgi:outer membrane protein assembly factor BamB
MRRDRSFPGSWILLIVLLLTAIPTTRAAKQDYSAIPTVAPAWTARFEQPVEWQRVTPMGQLVVATSSSLYGVDPSTGANVWTQGNLAGMVESSFEIIPATTLFVVSTEGVNNHTLVLDSTDGHVVFDSRAAGIANILTRTVLFESGGLLILGQEQGDPTIKLFFAEMATGKIRWRNDDVFAGLSDGMKKFVGLLAKVAQASMDLEEDADFAGRTVEIGPDAVVMTSNDGISKISTATGEFIWRVPNRDGEGKAGPFLIPSRPGMVLVATEIVGQGSSTNGRTPVQTKYCAYRLEDGSPVWEKSVKAKGTMHPPVFLTDGVIVSPGGDVKGRIKYATYDTGQSVWGKKGKGIDSDGGIVDHRATDHGLVVTTGFDSAWTNKGTEYYLNLLDTDAGAFRFEKSLKVRGRIVRTETVPKGVLYVTTHEVGLFDPKTGKSLLGKTVVSDALVTADSGPVLYAFAQDDGALYRIDKAQATATRLNEEKVKLEGKDQPRALEVDADGVTLLGAQHVIGFDHQGEVSFESYYPAPRHPGWVRALMIAQSVRAGLAAVEAGMAGAAFAQYASTQEDGTLQRQLGEELSTGYTKLSEGAAGISADYMKMAKQRFQASARSRDFQFMMVQLDRGYGIAQVGKSDGAIRRMIPIGKDRAPVYQVDDVADRVYYRVDEHQISGYAF